MLLPPGLDASPSIAAASPDTVGQHPGCTGLLQACAVQVETTVSNSVLRISGSWIGSSIGFGIMSSAIATDPYGTPASLPPRRRLFY